MSTHALSQAQLQGLKHIKVELAHSITMVVLMCVTFLKVVLGCNTLHKLPQSIGGIWQTHYLHTQLQIMHLVELCWHQWDNQLL